MKALITTVSLGLGLAATALVVGAQHQPSAFGQARRSLTPQDPALTAIAQPPTTVQEVTLRPRRVRRTQPVAAAPELDVKILAAPCRHGEYRKLEAGRGVYLMCPGEL